MHSFFRRFVSSSLAGLILLTVAPVELSAQTTNPTMEAIQDQFIGKSRASKLRAAPIDKFYKLAIERDGGVTVTPADPLSTEFSYLAQKFPFKGDFEYRFDYRGQFEGVELSPKQHSYLSNWFVVPGARGWISATIRRVGGDLSMQVSGTNLERQQSDRPVLFNTDTYLRFRIRGDHRVTFRNFTFQGERGERGTGAAPTPGPRGGPSGQPARSTVTQKSPLRTNAQWDTMEALPGLGEPFAEFTAAVAENQTIYQSESHELASKYGRKLVSVKEQLEVRGVDEAAVAVGGEIQRLLARDYSGYPPSTNLPDVVRHLRTSFEMGSGQLIGFFDQADMKTILAYDDILAEREDQLRADGDADKLTALARHRDLLLPDNLGAPASDTLASASPGTRPNSNKATGATNAPRGSARKRFAGRLANSMSTTQVEEHAAVLGPKPTLDAAGACPIAVVGMSLVNEITPSKVKAWGPLQAEIVQGEPCWTISVFYDVETLFGTIETQGKAIIQDGAVTRWIYAGSLEPIS